LTRPLFTVVRGRGALALLLRIASGIALSVAACQGPGSEQGAADAAGDSSVAGTTVDSILPVEEEIRRFREMAPETPAGLSGGEPSRDALVRRWVRAVERGDTTEIRLMLITAAEFITFYYPESPYTRPPYRQSPSLRWFLMTSQSNQGATRVMQRHGGQAFGFRSYQCDEPPETVGSLRIWSNCLVRAEAAGPAGQMRFFGAIVEREGVYKFLSYASDY